MSEFRTLASRPYHSEYLYHETVIDLPVEIVWPHVLDIGSWMSAHRLETIDGTAGQVGHLERVHPRSLAEGTPPPHYHLYGIAEIIPEKLVALEVFPEHGGSYGSSANKTSFDSILLTALGARTHLSFYMIDVLLTPQAGEALHHEDKEARKTRLRAVLDGYFDNLRARIAAGS